MERKTKWGKRLLVSYICLLSMLSISAQVRVSGTVTDPQNEPLIGASVLQKGTTNGTITDIDGKFSLNVSAQNAILEISFIGYEKKTIPLNGKTTVRVTLKDDSKALEEVVVVGYGVQKKSSLTGSVSQIKGDVLLTAPSTNVSQMLGGRLPGISSVQESGQPGEDQAALRIRGSKYEAVYIVDGMPRSINDLDPDEIESVSVLKDGSAAAVYGLQAAGGVVIVTTKKGREGKSQITYNGSLGASMNANFPEFLDGPGFAWYWNMGDMMDQLGNGTIKNANEYTPVFTKQNVADMLNGDPTDGWDNTDWIKKIYGTGFTQKHSVTAQGGTDKIRYFTSFGYLGQNGNIDNFDYKRYNLRTNVEANIANDLVLSVGVAGQVAKKNSPGYAAGGTDSDPALGEQGWLSVSHQTIAMHPYLPETYNGLYTSTPARNTGLPNSPLAAIYNSGNHKTNSLDIQTNISLQWNLPWVKGLNVKVSGAYDYSNSVNKNLNTPYTTNMIQLPTSTTKLGYAITPDPRASYLNMGQGETEYKKLVGQASMNYANTFFEKHHVDAMVLGEIRDEVDNNFSAYVRDLDFAELPELSQGSKINGNPIGGSNEKRSIGYVFRLRYDYDNKYLAEFTGRYDGSYKFAGNVSGKRWGFFPSGSVAWRISKEKFMEKLSFIDDLKIRASVGLLGSDNVSPYSFLSSYVKQEASGGSITVPARPVIINGQIVNSWWTNVIANQELSWEKTLTYNVGFDLTMWNGMLGVEFDAFYNYTYDILTWMGGNYPPSMGGYYATTENYNKIDTKGAEILLTHRNTIGQGKNAFKYGVGFNLTYAKNRYLKYPDSQNVPDYQKRTGKRIDMVQGWVAEGLYTTEEEIDNSAWYSTTRPHLGDIKYKDLNGDGKLDNQDRGFIGRSNRPELTFGLNLNGEWRGIDFNAQFVGGALFDISMTGTYYNSYDDNTVFTQTFKEGGNSPRFLVENAWRPDNPDGKYPRLTIGGLDNANGLASTFWFRDGKYLRLKSAQIGYTLPHQWIRKIGLQKLRVYAEGSNLFTWSGLPKGIDPEAPGVNNGYYPQQRTIMGGITLTF